MVKILAVCGMGLGSSFAVEMVAEEVLKDLGVEADISHIAYYGIRCSVYKG